MTWHCTYCSTNADGNYCSNCGAPADEKAERPKGLNDGCNYCEHLSLVSNDRCWSYFDWKYSCTDGQYKSFHYCGDHNKDGNCPRFTAQTLEERRRRIKAYYWKPWHKTDLGRYGIFMGVLMIPCCLVPLVLWLAGVF